MRLFILFSLGLFGPGSLALSVWASDLTAALNPANISGLSGSFNPTGAMPPAWDTARGVGAAQITQACQNYSSLFQTLAFAPQTGAAAAACGMTGAVSIETACPSSPMAPDISTINCDSIQYGQTQLLQRVQTQLDMSMCSLMCQKGKAEALQNSLQCLSAQVQGLQGQMGTLGLFYQQNIANMQLNMEHIKAAVTDNKAMIAHVSSQLNGDKASGKPGLIAAQQQLKTLVAGMPTQLQALKAQEVTNRASESALVNQIQQRKAGLMIGCFQNQTRTGYRCTTNGPPESFLAFLLCRYQQTQNQGTNGVIQRSATTAAQANASTAALKSILSQITTHAPSGAQISTDPKGIAASGQQSLLVLTPNDIEKRYGEQLAQFKIGNTNAKDFVMTSMNSCQIQASDEVNREAGQANTPIGQAQVSIQKEKQDFTQKVTTLLNQYNQSYSEGVTALNGSGTSLDTSSCSNAKVTPYQQIECINKIQTAVQGLLSGQGSVSVAQFQIRGNNPQNYITLSCSGLNQCISSLQGQKSTLDAYAGNIQQFQKNYLIAANLSERNYTQQLAFQMNFQSKQISEQMGSLNLALARLGQSGVSVPPTACEQSKFDSDGLIQSPTNVSKHLACFMEPPLPDLSGQGFATALGGIGRTVANLNQQETALASAKARLLSMPSTCAAAQNQQILQSLAEQTAGIDGCHELPACQNHPEQTINNMMAAVRAFGNAPGMSSSSSYSNSNTSLSMLTSGVSSFCDPAPGSVGQFGHGYSGQPNSYSAYPPGGGYGGGYSSVGRCRAFMSSLLGSKPMLQTGSGLGQHYGSLLGR